MDAVQDYLIDNGLIPDFVLRPLVRHFCRQRLREIDHGSTEANFAAKMAFFDSLRSRDIAIRQDKANEQHYEVSTDFLKSCLGPHMKYSSCYFPTGKETLEEAEVLILEMYCRKAKLQDGMEILDLGCGWGSLCLYLAQKYPKSKVHALSNSSTQKLHIDSTAKERGLTNLTVYTGDAKTFEFKGLATFDRVLSIEMFEHMKNYEMLLAKVSSWLKPNEEAVGSDGSLVFIHIFCHKTTPYDFEEESGWMARTFFTGGTMPSLDMFAYFQKDLELLKTDFLPGTHYSKTLEAWLKLQDSNASKWLGSGNTAMVEGKAGPAKEEFARKSFYQFRVFFLACSEFFNLHGGQEWGVGHYLFRKRD